MFSPIQTQRQLAARPNLWQFSIDFLLSGAFAISLLIVVITPYCRIISYLTMSTFTTSLIFLPRPDLALPVVENAKDTCVLHFYIN